MNSLLHFLGLVHGSGQKRSEFALDSGSPEMAAP
jgi:hypothetical protein